MKLPLAFVLAATVVLAACSRPEPLPDPVRAVRTMTIQPASASATWEYAGEIRSRTESRLGFRVGGKIVSRRADLGDLVKAGQVLAQLDAQDLKLGQDAARAAMSAAQVNHDQAQADYRRFKELRDQGFISSAELERRETALKAAKAQLEQALAQSSVQGNQAGYAVLVADAGGVITGVDAEPGMVVAAGAPVVRLAHDGPRDVLFAVPEDKVETIRQLAALTGRFKVRLWGDNGAPLPAAIREIAGSADPVTRTFLVKADIGKASVRLGQTATVLVELPPASGVAKLPLSALKEEQGKTVVWVVDRHSMTVQQQGVTLAGADGNEAVVSAGLAPGQVVVTAGVHVLNPGQKVKFYVDPGAPPPGNAAVVPTANASVSVK